MKDVIHIKSILIRKKHLIIWQTEDRNANLNNTFQNFRTKIDYSYHNNVSSTLTINSILIRNK